MIRRFPIQAINRKPRPATYLNELRAIAVASDEKTLTIDDESPGYLALVEKYRAYKPTKADRKRCGAIRTDCRFRGKQIDSVKCPTCAGTVMLKVFSCEKHERCTIGKAIKGIQSCARCPDFCATRE